MRHGQTAKPLRILSVCKFCAVSQIRQKNINFPKRFTGENLSHLSLYNRSAGGLTKTCIFTNLLGIEPYRSLSIPPEFTHAYFVPSCVNGSIISPYRLSPVPAKTRRRTFNRKTETQFGEIKLLMCVKQPGSHPHTHTHGAHTHNTITHRVFSM